MRRPKTPLKAELPLIVFLAVLWMAAWQSFTLGTFILGLVYSTIIVRVFYLPPLRGSGRFNPLWALVFSVRFLWKMTAASFHVAHLVFTQGPKVGGSITSVQLRSHDDFIVTLVGHALALVPGSLVLDVDRTTATLYLHCLDVRDDDDAERIRRDALRTESLMIRTLGNRSDLAVVKAEKRLGRVSGLSRDERGRPVERRHRAQNGDTAQNSDPVQNGGGGER